MDWQTVTNNVTAFVKAAEPAIEAAAGVAETVDPAIAAGVSIGEKILQGAIAGEPTAVALAKSIFSGETPTPAKIQQYDAEYEVDYQQTKADLRTAIAALPPAG